MALQSLQSLRSCHTAARPDRAPPLPSAKGPSDQAARTHVRCDIDHTAHLRVIVKLRKEVLSLLILSDLGELEGNGVWAISGPGKLARGIDDDLGDSKAVFSGRSTVRNGDDENRLLKGVGARRTEDQRL